MVAEASSGLGLSIACQLAAEGARVSIASRTHDRIAQATSTISVETGSDSEVRGYVFDARNDDSIKQWVQATLNDFHQIDTERMTALSQYVARREGITRNQAQANNKLEVGLTCDLLSHAKIRRMPFFKLCDRNYVLYTSTLPQMW